MKKLVMALALCGLFVGVEAADQQPVDLSRAFVEYAARVDARDAAENQAPRARGSFLRQAIVAAGVVGLAFTARAAQQCYRATNDGIPLLESLMCQTTAVSAVTLGAIAGICARIIAAENRKRRQLGEAIAASSREKALWDRSCATENEFPDAKKS